MKKLIPALLISILIASCNSGSNSTSDKDGSASTSNLDYPYKIAKPDQWQTGDPRNSVLATKAIKAYENGNIDETVSYFADTVELNLDEYKAILSKDSLRHVLAEARSQCKDIKIRMDDWEPVISKDKKEQWVTVWYKQTTTDSKGQVDSVSVINDMKIINGKIAQLDETIRRYPKHTT